MTKKRMVLEIGMGTQLPVSARLLARYAVNVLPVIREIRPAGLKSLRGGARALAVRPEGPRIACEPDPPSWASHRTREL